MSFTNLSVFPNPKTIQSNDIIAIGGFLNKETLWDAYSHGIFPWPHPNHPLLWFCPNPRAILEFSDFHIPSRVIRELKKVSWTFKKNTYFEKVIRNCATISNRKGQTGTWITENMIQAYIDFHQAGYVTSYEVWDEKHQLIGGLYGVRIGNFFAGESMFHHVSGASKYALIHTIESLKKEGLTWMDIQQLTPLLQLFGGKEIPRKDFLEKLAPPAQTL